MKATKVFAILGLTLVLLCAAAFGEEESLIEQHPVLDAAFSLLEEGNPIAEKYRLITGARVESVFPCGLPYLHGGTHEYVRDGEPLLFSRAPEYAVAALGEVTTAKDETGFYQQDRTYLYGLDGAGFTQWICAQVGWPRHDELQSMINAYQKYGAAHHLYSQRRGMDMPPYNRVAQTLELGDMLVAKKGTRHIMMFIGTLREFGFTAETAPELADYLDYPLVVHCGRNPDYPARIKKYLEDRADDPYYADVHLPIGGVCVSIIGPRPKDAPHDVYESLYTYYYFDLDGYRLTLWDIEAATSFCWYRIPLDEE